MDGRNSSGRKVSLLNDFCAAAPPLAPVGATRSSAVPAKLHPLTAIVNSTRHSHSESPSGASTPSLSPQTPPLVRSESSDSRAFASPSPLTPNSTSFDHASQLGQKQQQHQSYYLYRQPWAKMDDPTLYPAIPEGAPMGAYPLPPINTNAMSAQVPRIRSSDSPVSDSRISNVSNASASAVASNAKQTAKKSQYPCPLAKQYKCNDFFTTSGHAARHAKKHTGRKDAICPECNKAFTRKDNMEQHRRTHQNVRGPTSKATENRVKKPVKQHSRKTDRGSMSGPLEAATVAQLDEQAQQQLVQPEDFPALPNTIIQAGLLPGSGSGPYYMDPNPVSALPQPMAPDYATRPHLYRSNYTNSMDFTSAITPTLGDPADLHFNYPSPGVSNGLNTLALVASDHRRMSEEATSTKSTSTTP